MDKKDEAASVPTAFLVDLVSNRKIPITTPRCRVGRDDLNDIVISGDQSISRFHFIITYENGQYQTQDAKSRHGTFLNGNQIGGPEPINDGDVLKIGVSLFWFVIESQAGTEKDEPLPPVDVDKTQRAEEVSLKKGGDYSYSGEAELSATQEISIISPEQLAQYALTRPPEDNEFEAKEPAKSDSDSEKASSKEDDKSEKPVAEKAADEAKDSKPESAENTESKEKEPESKASKEEEQESKQDESPASDSKKDDEEDKPKSDSKDSKDAEEKSFEPEKQADSSSESKDGSSDSKETKSSDIEIAVKDLLEPLQDEIAASREMIKDALKKGEMSFESDAAKTEDDKKEPEQAGSEDEKPETSKEDDAKAPETKESSSDSNGTSKSDEPSNPDEDSDEKKSEPESPSETDSEQAETTAKKNKGEDEKSEEAETLERIAEIIDDSTAKSDLAEKGEESPSVSANRIETSLESDHDKATNGFSEDIGTIMGPTSVPDWCKRYFSDELKHLNKELDTLNDQIKQYQEKIRKIESQAAQTKGMRNTLLTADGDDLIEACKQVLGLAGWKVTQSEEDKHEFLLEKDDEKVAIARVISIKGSAERSHLGQLSISQTRFWCEKGIEPKGVLIVGRVSDKSPKERGEDTNTEVIEYANMKNVCLMNTLQLLAIYRDLALKDGKSSELRNSIHDSKGWLKGFDLEPGDEMVDEDEKEATKSKSLSSLLSA